MTKSHHRTVLITGGSSGLGLAMARHLAMNGYTPVILARNVEKIESAVASLQDYSKDAVGFSCDVTSYEDLTSVAEKIKDICSGIDFLILNAGVVHVNQLVDFTNIDDLKADIDIDLWGTVLAARVFVPLLSPQARVLCISSGFGLMGAAGYPAYCAAKAGVINFAAALRRELLHRKISVYVACPADIDTPQYHEEKSSMPEWMEMAGARGSVLPPDTAAKKILRKCTGDRFLILINFEISLLLFLNRLMPLRWMNAIMDRIFPRPS